MVYWRMLIAIIVVVSSVQFITCTETKDGTSIKGKPPIKSDTLSKSRESTLPTKGRPPTSLTQGGPPTPPSQGKPPTLLTKGGPLTSPILGRLPILPTKGGPPTPPNKGGPPTLPTKGRPPTPPIIVRPPIPLSKDRAPTQGRVSIPPTQERAPIQERTLIQEKTPTQGRAPISPTQGREPTPPIQGRDPNKDGVPPRTNPLAKNGTPPMKRAPSIARSKSRDYKKPSKPSQDDVQSPEEKSYLNESNNSVDNGTGSQSKLLMPFRAIQRTGSFLVKSAFNTLTAPLSGKNKTQDDKTQ